VQVKFTEWTADRRMRQPIFLGLREDKESRQCKFEAMEDTTQAVMKAEGKAQKFNSEGLNVVKKGNRR
jgi:ATP-dependent DNA ligase